MKIELKPMAILCDTMFFEEVDLVVDTVATVRRVYFDGDLLVKCINSGKLLDTRLRGRCIVILEVCKIRGDLIIRCGAGKCMPLLIGCFIEGAVKYDSPWIGLIHTYVGEGIHSKRQGSEVYAVASYGQVKNGA